MEGAGWRVQCTPPTLQPRAAPAEQRAIRLRGLLHAVTCCHMLLHVQRTIRLRGLASGGFPAKSDALALPLVLQIAHRPEARIVSSVARDGRLMP